MSTTGHRPHLLASWQSQEALRPLGTGEVLVLTVELGPRERSDDEIDRFPEFEILNLEERARALRFVRPRDRRRFLLCRSALRLILGRLTGIAPERLEFRAGPGGKPELEPEQNPSGSLRFNVTHSADLALIAVTDGREVGVDLERIRPIKEAERIVESYFTPDEISHFLQLNPQDRPLAFLRGWTRKEAILKAKGVGLAGLATCYQTMFGTTDLHGQFALATPHATVGEWVLWEASPWDEHIAALAVGEKT